MAAADPPEAHQPQEMPGAASQRSTPYGAAVGVGGDSWRQHGRSRGGALVLLAAAAAICTAASLATRPGAVELSAAKATRVAAPSASRGSGKKASGEGLHTSFDGPQGSVQGASMPYAEAWSPYARSAHFLAGEKHALDNVFSQAAAQARGVSASYDRVQPALVNTIRSELRHKVNAEVERQVRGRQGMAMREIGKGISRVEEGMAYQKDLAKQFEGVHDRIDEMEKALCEGQPCEKFPKELQEARERAGRLQGEHDEDLDKLGKLSKEVVADARALRSSQEEAEDWRKRAGDLQVEVEELRRRLNASVPAPPAPAPPKGCHGLVELSGASGTIASGPGPTAPHLCRWIINSPSRSRCPRTLPGDGKMRGGGGVARA